jgi:hypothetical protein
MVPAWRRLSIRELDIVALTCDVPVEGLTRDDTGTVVHVLGDGAAFLVAFMDSDGETVTVPYLIKDQVRPAAPGELQRAQSELVK